MRGTLMLITVLSVLLSLGSLAEAHEVRPSVADVVIKDGKVRIDVEDPGLRQQCRSGGASGHGHGRQCRRLRPAARARPEGAGEGIPNCLAGPTGGYVH